MSHEHETPSGAFVNFLAAVVKAAPRDLSRELMLAWTENGEELTRVLRGVLLEGPQDSDRADERAEEPQTLHKDICIAFELGGQQFEAVGFLKDEESILGEEAIKRVDNGHIIRSEEDWQFLYENRHSLPPELNNFWLVTARPNPGSPRDVSCLGRYDDEWCDFWYCLDHRWDRSVLVLRRRV